METKLDELKLARGMGTARVLFAGFVIFLVLFCLPWSINRLAYTQSNIPSGSVYANQFSGSDIFAQANAAAASLNGNPGEIVIPPGIYKGVTTTLIGLSNTRFSAYGAIIFYSGSSVALDFSGVQHSGIVGLKLLGSGSGTGLLVRGFNGIVAQSNSFRDLVIGGLNNQFTTDVSVQGASGNNGTYGNYFESVFGWHATQDGLDILPATPTYANANVFINCSWLYNGRDGIRIDGGDANQFIANWNETNGRSSRGYGVNLVGSSETIGNVFIGGWYGDGASARNISGDFNFGSRTKSARTYILGAFVASPLKLVGSYDSPSNVIITQSGYYQIGNVPVGNESSGANSLAREVLEADVNGLGSDALRIAALGSPSEAQFALLPGGASHGARLRFYNSSDPANAGWLDFVGGANEFRIQPGASGTGSKPSHIEYALPVRLTPSTFSTLSCTNKSKGMLASIVDSQTTSWGDQISGGGANTVLAYCNGRTWTVVAK